MPEPLGLTDPVEMLDQPQPGRLGDVRRIVPRETMRPGRRPDQAREAIDDRVPGGSVSARGLFDKLSQGHDAAFDKRGRTTPRPGWATPVALRSSQASASEAPFA